eukprot:TRINITY_DN10133_c0_g1_i5.p1 TRINITY_DN10133_c0_g1~~TRINITY_DN10133_c0_g1_i5.p1  ORF type:complete len:472 (-),score=89.52 TRINITY_DN10133_c0_g1_i5:95-1510(-)
MEKVIIIGALALLGVNALLSGIALILNARQTSTSSETVDNVSVLLRIAKSAMENPINSLAFAKNGVCPEGMTLEELTTWPGTVSGCYCPTQQFNDLRRGTCATEEKLKYACRTIPSKKQIALTKWNAFSFCSKRVPSFTLRKHGEICAEGKKDCSSSLCIPKDSECPITSISLNKPDPNGANETTVESNGDRIYMYKTYDAPPLLQLSVLPGQACFNPSHQAKRKLEAYPLLSVGEDWNQGCGKLGEDADNARTLDSTTEESFLVHGAKLDVDALPKYSSFLKEKVYLVAEQQIPLDTRKAECLSIDYSGLRETPHIGQKMKVVLFWFSCGLLAVAVVGLIASGYFSRQKEGLNSPLYLTVAFIVLGVTLLVHAARLFYTYRKLQELSRIQTDINTFAQQRCFHDERFVPILKSLVADNQVTNLLKGEAILIILILVATLAWMVLKVIQQVRARKTLGQNVSIDLGYQPIN